jgi:hypothetical protein
MIHFDALEKISLKNVKDPVPVFQPIYYKKEMLLDTKASPSRCSAQLACPARADVIARRALQAANLLGIHKSPDKKAAGNELLPEVRQPGLGWAPE